jgi:hypothetical protein
MGATAVSLLYTVVPPEEVWAEETPGGQEGSPFFATTWHGVSLLAKRTPEGAVIERLLTTDPYLYLDPELQPGHLLAW